MTEQEKMDYVFELENKLLLGSIILSEWVTFLSRDAETAFYAGANLAALLTAMATIETHLRSEDDTVSTRKNISLYELVENAGISTELKTKIHLLRKYRNQWVHVDNPIEDEDLLNNPELHEQKLEDMAKLAIEAMLEIIFHWQWS